MQACLTIDVEHDCPPFRNSYRGIEEGLPKLLELLDAAGVKATFFVTGDVARKFPEAVKNIAGAGHEIGCHGDTHARFDRMSFKEAENELLKATETLRKFYPVVSFRGPNLQFPKKFLLLLKMNGYLIDSTEGRHKRAGLKIRNDGGILRVPVSTTSLVIRSPKILRELFLKRMRAPVVLMMHPWEFVDFTGEKLRFDCRWRTGEFSLRALRETISFFKTRRCSFEPLCQVLEIERPVRS